MKPSRLLKTLPCLFILLAVSAGPAVADDDLRLRVLGQSISSSGDVLGPEDLDDGFGAYVGVEKIVNDRWGLEFGIGLSEMETRQFIEIDQFFYLIGTEVDLKLQWTPVTLGANFHLTPGRSADLYIAPRVGWAFVEDLDATTTVLSIEDGPLVYPIEAPPQPVLPPENSSVAADHTFLYGARLGLDWPIGDGAWGLSGALDYTVMGPEIDGEDVDIDPLAIGFGLTHRW